MALLGRKYHFVLEFQRISQVLSRLHFSPLSRIFCGGYPFCRCPFFSLSLAPDFRRTLSYLYFHLLSAFLGVLHAPACTTYLPSRLREASTRCCFLGSPSTGFLRREDGRANSFKSRCGAGNSANPLRIHRAPLANSSLAPNIFLSAHPFTAHRARARTIVFSSLAFLLFLILFRAFPSDPSASFQTLVDPF